MCNARSAGPSEVLWSDGRWRWLPTEGNNMKATWRDEERHEATDPIKLAEVYGIEV
jgi:hypothetical protein